MGVTNERFDQRSVLRVTSATSARSRRTGPGRLALALAAAALVLGACGGGSAEASGSERSITVRVFAAASLTEAMTELEQAFELVEPTVEVELNLAGSATLRAQILEGAPADVIATANPAVMADLVAADAVAGEPIDFATNRLVLALAPDNPGRLEGLSDLATPELFVGLCAAGVPCGDLADRVLDAAGVAVEADTREPDVRSLLTKIEAGELDAGLVYATDLVAATGVVGVDLDPDLPATATYPAATLTDGGAAGRRFVDFLTGAEGRRILTDHGFGTP